MAGGGACTSFKTRVGEVALRCVEGESCGGNDSLSRRERGGGTSNGGLGGILQDIRRIEQGCCNWESFPATTTVHESPFYDVQPRQSRRVPLADHDDDVRASRHLSEPPVTYQVNVLRVLRKHLPGSDTWPYAIITLARNELADSDGAEKLCAYRVTV